MCTGRPAGHCQLPAGRWLLRRCRSRQYILDLAHRAGLELVDSSRQSDMAEGFVDVYMLAFKPAQHIGAASTA